MGNKNVIIMIIIIAIVAIIILLGVLLSGILTAPQEDLNEMANDLIENNTINNGNNVIDDNDDVSGVTTQPMISGPEFNKMIMDEIGQLDTEKGFKVNKTILGVEFSDEIDFDSYEDAGYSWDLSLNEGDEEVVAWIEIGTKVLHIQTDGMILAHEEQAAMNEDDTIDAMFLGFQGVTFINFNEVYDTSEVTDMSGMFAYCTSLETLDLTSFDTSSVTNMLAMFMGNESVEVLDLTSFDITEDTLITGMLQGVPTSAMIFVKDEDTKLLLEEYEDIVLEVNSSSTEYLEYLVARQQKSEEEYEAAQKEENETLDRYQTALNEYIEEYNNIETENEISNNSAGNNN